MDERPDTVPVLVALGSNLGDATGDPASVVARAIAWLRASLAADLEASTIWRTEPVDCPPGSPEFANAVVAFRCAADVTPEALLESLLALERVWGERDRRVVNAPRVLDLDLLVFGDARRNGPDLVLPHPRALARRFVLGPAAEVAPDLVWPGTGRTVARLLDALDAPPST